MSSTEIAKMLSASFKALEKATEKMKPKRMLMHYEHSGEEILGYNEDWLGLPQDGMYLLNSSGALCLCTPEIWEKITEEPSK